jgi:hypothetical protein
MKIVIAGTSSGIGRFLADRHAIAPGVLPARMIEEIVGLGAATAGEAEIAAARETLGHGDKGCERVGELVDFLLSSKSDGINGKLISAIGCKIRICSRCAGSF